MLKSSSTSYLLVILLLLYFLYREREKEREKKRGRESVLWSTQGFAGAAFQVSTTNATIYIILIK